MIATALLLGSMGTVALAQSKGGGAGTSGSAGTPTAAQPGAAQSPAPAANPNSNPNPNPGSSPIVNPSAGFCDDDDRRACAESELQPQSGSDVQSDREFVDVTEYDIDTSNAEQHIA